MTNRAERGFTLIEAVVSVSLLSVGVMSLAQLAIVSGRANAAAYRTTVAQYAARERLEELRALAWTSDAGVVPVSDWSTDLSASPPAPTGGVGIGVSPPGALQTNTDRFCDFLDGEGRWVGAGTRPPPGASWVRRWSVATVVAPADALVLQVVVLPLAALSHASARATNGAWLTTIRSRRTR